MRTRGSPTQADTGFAPVLFQLFMQELLVDTLPERWEVRTDNSS